MAHTRRRESRHGRLGRRRTGARPSMSQAAQCSTTARGSSSMPMADRGSSVMPMADRGSSVMPMADRGSSAMPMADGGVEPRHASFHGSARQALHGSENPSRTQHTSRAVPPSVVCFSAMPTALHPLPCRAETRAAAPWASPSSAFSSCLRRHQTAQPPTARGAASSHGQVTVKSRSSHVV